MKCKIILSLFLQYIFISEKLKIKEHFCSGFPFGTSKMALTECAGVLLKVMSFQQTTRLLIFDVKSSSVVKNKLYQDWVSSFILSRFVMTMIHG